MGFCRCFAFRIGKIRDHNGIIRNFQFRKFLPVKSNHKSFHGRYFINLQINVASSKQARLPKHVVAAEYLYGQQTSELPEPYQHMHSPRFTTTVAADR